MILERQVHSMKKAVVFLADGCEMVEALTPVDMLRRAGIEVVTVSITGSEKVVSSHKVGILADKVYEDGIADDADVVILPGGKLGTSNLGAHAGVTNTVKTFFENGKYIAAICAAPSIFGQMGLLNGKKAVCYPSFEEKLIGATVCKDEVMVDGNIITSRGMGTAIVFSKALIEVLLNKDIANAVTEEIIFQAED